MTMITSAIRHPEKDIFIMRRNWQLQALLSLKASTRRDGNEETGAEILSVLEFHHNNRLANKLLAQLINKAVQKNNRHLKELGDWLPYSMTYWIECLLGRGRFQIEKALDMLLELKFINNQVPDDIPKFYASTNNWYRLETDTINKWIDEHTPRTYKLDVKKMIFIEPDTQQSIKEVLPPERYQQKAKLAEKTDDIQIAINTICLLHKHIFNKNANTIYDKDRHNFIKKRLREKRTVEQCLQAVIGLSLNPFFMGENDRNEILDNIDYIFKTNAQFERHLNFAIEKGVTEEIAKRQVVGMKNGVPSQYVRTKAKGVQIASNEQTDANSSALSTAIRQMPLDLQKRYKEFARHTASFFLTNSPLALIFDQCRNDVIINKAGNGLTDEPYLIYCLNNACVNLRINGISESVKTNIEQFAKTFCKLQSVNKGK